MDNLKKLIREVPDFPKPGINFYDITTLLKDPEGFEQTIDALTEMCRGIQVDTVIGVESRGFILRLRSRISSGRDSSRSASPRSFPLRSSQSRMSLNTARIPSRCIKTLSARA